MKKIIKEYCVSILRIVFALLNMKSIVILKIKVKENKSVPFAHGTFLGTFSEIISDNGGFKTVNIYRPFDVLKNDIIAGSVAVCIDDIVSISVVSEIDDIEKYSSAYLNFNKNVLK